MTYAFVFDASACTGCKACQVACKDKNLLPLGVLWRRVYEVTGGTWQQQGAAWTNTIFGSTLSLACNHCVHPRCVGVCPTNACTVRPDGIVYINPSKCTGCGYCTWACPYDAPQPDTTAGVYSKCDLCRDYLDQGLPPACVSACPMRCLDLVNSQEGETIPGSIALWKVPAAEHPAPLPATSRTEPHLIIHPHPSSNRNREDAQVSNREEITPGTNQPSIRREIPLVLFTLLTQMAAGSVGVVFFLGNLVQTWQAIRENLLLPLVVALSATLLGIRVAFLHLGTPGNAWRMVSHPRKSWLSRELLLVSLFTVFTIALLGLVLFPPVLEISWLGAAGITFLAGAALVWVEHSVYRLHMVPEWDTFRVLAEFTGTSLLLGSLGTGLLLPIDLLQMTFPGLVLTATAGSLLELAILPGRKTHAGGRVFSWRIALLLVNLLFLIMFLVLPLPEFSSRIGLVILFLLSLAGEILGRMEFYSRRRPGI